MQEFDNKCMVAHGWSLSNQTSPSQPNPKVEQLKSAAEERKSCVRAVRGESVYRPLLPHLSDVDTGRFSIAQLADDNLPTSAESKLLVPYLDEALRCADKFVATASQIAPPVGSIFAQQLSETQSIALELIKRQISWGKEAERQQAVLDETKTKLSEVHL